MMRATTSSGSSRSIWSSARPSPAPALGRSLTCARPGSNSSRSWLTGARMRYRTSRSVAPASSGWTVTELWTENPVCFHDKSSAILCSSMSPSLRSSDGHSVPEQELGRLRINPWQRNPPTALRPTAPTHDGVDMRMEVDRRPQFAERASSYAKPLDNTDFQMTWRKAMARQYLAGVLRELRS